MKKIPLTKGYIAMVDDEDYERFGSFVWGAHVQPRSTGLLVYAVRRGPTVNGKRSSLRLHREIIGAKKGECVDHIDGNTLNNCRSNLRVCDHTGNMRNMKAKPGCSSAFKGVQWRGEYKKWTAQIRVDGKQKHLGSFPDEISAAVAYDHAATQHYGEFARVNFNPTAVEGK